MSRSKVPPDRLYQVLQTTGLQNKDNPLYQFLFYVIGNIIDLTDNSGSGGGGGGGGGGSTVIINTTLGIPGNDGQDGMDAFPIPGPAGEDGANGMVPYFIATGETFTVPEFKQALFAMNIDNEGTLEVDGYLIEVD